MKKLFIFSAVLAVSFMCGIFVYKVNARQAHSSLTLANIEALTGGESSGNEVKCYCKTNWFSPNVCSANADGSYCGGDPCDSHDGNCR